MQLFLRRRIMEHSRLIGKYISIIYRQGQCYINKRLEPYGIGSGQFIFLNILYHKDGIRQEDMAEFLDIDKGTTARAIKRLEEEGYVYRKTDSEDHRAQLIFLTQKAKDIEDDIKNILKSWTEILLSDFSMEDCKKAEELMEAMTNNIHRYYEREERFNGRQTRAIKK
jgi:DNA-binding MarR family transcriptional regulator